MTHFRPTIDAIEAYVPGEQPAPGTCVVKLNTNENPYPPSPLAIAALKNVNPDDLRRYPHPFAEQFRKSAAEVLDIDPAWILVGNGSDDLLTMLIRSITGTNRAVAFPVPTYVLYRTLGMIQEAPVVEIPFDDAYTLPVDALVQTNAALTLIANPNSPSGTCASTVQLADLASRLDGVLAIDEAYVAFADTDALELVQRFDRMIVLRTLSKSHSLAGLRLGFGVANPTLLAGLTKVKDSYNVDAVAAHVGAAAIRDTKHTSVNINRIRQSRTQMSERLQALGFRVWPSQANFLLVQPPGNAAQQLYKALKSRGILVRYFNVPGLTDKLRITIGTDDQNAELTRSLKTLMSSSDDNTNPAQ